MSLTIVMYHYVRELKHSRFPEIKGLAADLFRQQVAYLQRHYQPVSAYQVMDAVQGGPPLPPRAVLLSFDDGYLDHFTEVFPVLDKAGISGAFFPPARCILERRMLDVNKIHFILASVPDKAQLVQAICEALGPHRAEHGLASDAHYLAQYRVPNRYDVADVCFIKDMLQRGLPEVLRGLIADELFARFVSRDEQAFAREVYMSVEQIACLQRHGQYVGSHGYNHYWLDSIPPETQRLEIDRSLDFLAQVGSPTDRWMMCYPYGAHDASVRGLLAERRCVVGLTTDQGIARLDRDAPLVLPRLDTNDLPKAADAAANDWTRQAA